MPLVASNLGCGYRTRSVFAHVSLTIEAGELLAVLGPNGAGKTTLLKALSRLIRPMAGTVTLGGTDVWRLSPSVVASHVAFAPQVMAPDWPFTVHEFVSLGRAPHRGWWRPLTAADRRIIDESLEKLSVTALRHRTVTELSGGEWQRVRLAKALTQQPQVLLLDEPTAHLDPRYQLDLLTAIRHLTRAQNLAVVMTLHDLNLVGPWADRVALLANGGLLAVGSPADVLTTDILAAAYGVRLAVAPHPLTATPSISLAPLTGKSS